MAIPFIKIQNAGNDYIYVDRKSISRVRTNKRILARQMSDRRRGVGSDGLIIVDRIDSKSAFVEIYNSDGSMAEYCANGIRGTVLYLRKILKCRTRKFSIATNWNDYSLEVVKSSDRGAVIRGSSGNPVFDTRVIGYAERTKHCLGVTVRVGGRRRVLYCVAMPNPHAVIFVDNFNFCWQKEGAILERNPIFRRGINVMFAIVESPRRIAVRPWERGSGATLSCGSGAAAATVISALLGYTKGKVNVVMPGGILKTLWDIEENMVYQEGPSRMVFTGSYKI